jgi:ribosomal protein S18 acetylase RimI-like enzyme
LSPGSYVLLNQKQVVGYLISHPYIRDKSAPLNTLIHEIPETPDTWYIHDLAILPEFRGRGMVRPVLEDIKALALSHGIKELSLVSVYGTEVFWTKMGFRHAPNGTYGTLMKQTI